MSAFYQINGTIRVRKCREAEAVIDRLRGHHDGGIEVDLFECSPGVLEVLLGGGALVSGGGARDCDELVQSLGPYVVEPAIIETAYESESCDLVVAGSDEEGAQALSRHRIEQIEVLLREVTPEDRAKLADQLRSAQVL